jgi:hypothetical protein
MYNSRKQTLKYAAMFTEMMTFFSAEKKKHNCISIEWNFFPLSPSLSRQLLLHALFRVLCHAAEGKCVKCT